MSGGTFVSLVAKLRDASEIVEASETEVIIRSLIPMLIAEDKYINGDIDSEEFSEAVERFKYFIEDIVNRW